jgi:iron complex transport system substrate-binding protein
MRFFVIFITLFLFQVGVGQAREYVDQAGRQVVVPEPVTRIVALAPSITEIVYELGREKLLIGATQYSNTPTAARGLPRVGSYVRLDIEKIVALNPDLCLGIKDGNPAHTVEKIEALGIPVYIVDPKNLDDIIDVVRRFGDLLAAPATSERLMRTMRSRIDRVVEMVARAKSKPGVFFQIDAAPIITIGTNTFIHELITLAGGRNLAAGPQDYPRYNWEDVLVLQPEVAIVASMAGGHSPQELLAGWRRWPQIPAVYNNRIHVVDANLIDRPTPRLLDGLELFVGIIHPELLGELHAD